MNTNKKVRAHIFVSGKVHGVFFRAHTAERARELGITGWVRNWPDGRVEAVFEGEKEKVKEMVEWTKKGPPVARVNNIDIEWQEYQGEFENFEIRYD